MDRPLQLNSLYRAVNFANFKGILGFSVPQSSEWGRGYANHIALAHLHLLANPLRRERESFKQNVNKSIKLKTFTLLPEATSMSRDELSPEPSVENENVGSSSTL